MFTAEDRGDTKLNHDTLKIIQQRRKCGNDNDGYKELNKKMKEIRTYNIKQKNYDIEKNTGINVIRSKLSRGKVRISKMMIKV